MLRLTFEPHLAAEEALYRSLLEQTNVRGAKQTERPFEPRRTHGNVWVARHRRLILHSFTAMKFEMPILFWGSTVEWKVPGIWCGNELPPRCHLVTTGG